MNYSLNDIKTIVKALKEANPWNSLYIIDIRRRIKDSHLSKSLPICCYCLRDFTGEFRLDVDIEHILPKSIYTNCIFDLENLNIACKRCNMQIKKADLEFLTTDLKQRYGKWKHWYFKSQHYKFIHPNLDHVYDHMDIISTRINDVNFKKYIPKAGSEKGRYTYKYFKLNELESDSFTKAQGGDPIEKDTEIAIEINDIFKRHGL